MVFPGVVAYRDEYVDAAENLSQDGQLQPAHKPRDRNMLEYILRRDHVRKTESQIRQYALRRRVEAVCVDERKSPLSEQPPDGREEPAFGPIGAGHGGVNHLRTFPGPHFFAKGAEMLERRHDEREAISFLGKQRIGV